MDERTLARAMADSVTSVTSSPPPDLASQARARMHRSRIVAVSALVIASVTAVAWDVADVGVDVDRTLQRQAVASATTQAPASCPGARTVVDVDSFSGAAGAPSAARLADSLAHSNLLQVAAAATPEVHQVDARHAVIVFSSAARVIATADAEMLRDATWVAASVTVCS